MSTTTTSSPTCSEDGSTGGGRRRSSLDMILSAAISVQHSQLQPRDIGMPLILSKSRVMRFRMFDVVYQSHPEPMYVVPCSVEWSANEELSLQATTHVYSYGARVLEYSQMISQSPRDETSAMTTTTTTTSANSSHFIYSLDQSPLSELLLRLTESLKASRSSVENQKLLEGIHVRLVSLYLNINTRSSPLILHPSSLKQSLKWTEREQEDALLEKSSHDYFVVKPVSMEQPHVLSLCYVPFHDKDAATY